MFSIPPSSSSPYQPLVQGGHARQPDKLPSMFISSTVPVVHENTTILGPHTLPSPPPTRKAMVGLGMQQTQLTAVEPAELAEEYRSFPHGNPYEERKICLSQELLDSDELSPVTVVSPARMIDQFLIKARRASELAKRTSAPLLLLIFCHGLPNFHLFLNNGDTQKGLSMVRLKGVLELGVRVTLITTACHSGGWATNPPHFLHPEGWSCCELGCYSGISQVLAECAACDYANLKEGHWVPVLAILCDGSNFEFLVYDSADKAIYSSGRTPGIVAAERGDYVDLLSSTKRTCKYLFNWFVMGCIALEDEICSQ
ncbi:hypothetical protein N7465_006539 [Penicillium sp. CMV-2018d]|nr:hypothetical protein N7465_006539 [Penicillium sp. CMV-2018d]